MWIKSNLEIIFSHCYQFRHFSDSAPRHACSASCRTNDDAGTFNDPNAAHDTSVGPPYGSPNESPDGCSDKPHDGVVTESNDGSADDDELDEYDENQSTIGAVESPIDHVDDESTTTADDVDDAEPATAGCDNEHDESTAGCDDAHEPNESTAGFNDGH